MNAGATGCTNPETGESISDSEFIRRFPERVPEPVIASLIASSTTAAAPAYECPRCDGQVYLGLTHHCPTAVKA